MGFKAYLGEKEYGIARGTGSANGPAVVIKIAFSGCAKSVQLLCNNVLSVQFLCNFSAGSAALERPELVKEPD